MYKIICFVNNVYVVNIFFLTQILNVFLIEYLAKLGRLSETKVKMYPPVLRN